MKILVIGATGTIGRAVSDALAANHDVIRAGHSDGDVQVDIGSAESISALLEQVGELDAVISTAGLAQFGPLAELSDEALRLGLDNKLLGQVELTRQALGRVRDGGSITLTSGVLATEPMPGSAAIAMANGAIDGFTRAAALEMPRDIRINVVSPVFVSETMEMMGMDSSQGMPAAKTALAYVAAVEGEQSGQVLDVRDFV